MTFETATRGDQRNQTMKLGEKKDNNKYRYRFTGWPWWAVGLDGVMHGTNQARNGPPHRAEPGPEHEVSCLESVNWRMRNDFPSLHCRSIALLEVGWVWDLISISKEGGNQCNDISGVIGMESQSVRYRLWIDTMANTIRCWDNPSISIGIQDMSERYWEIIILLFVGI